MRLGTRRLLSIFVARLIVGAVLGALFGIAAGITVMEPRMLGAALGALSGAIDGTALMALGGGVHMLFPRTRLGKSLERAPLAVAFAIRLLFYGGVILCVVGGAFGPRMVALVVGGELGPALGERINAKLPIAITAAVALMVTGFFVLLDILIRIVGEQAFRDLALGRYRRARYEERFFLYVDIEGSTPLAEKLGPEAMHRFLSRVFAIASDPIDDHGGEIYQYVGDELVITWTLEKGRPRARPLACFFAIEHALKNSAAEFEAEFGTVPRLRAALHAGQVITGEVGGSRRAIVFHGDVMNTASRLENATRTLQRPFLASEDALSRIEDREAFATEDLGPQQLRGRVAPVHVHAVDDPAGRAGLQAAAGLSRAPP